MPSNYSTNQNIQSEVFTPTWIWHPSWERVQQSNALFPKDLQCRWRSKRHTHLQHLHSHLVTSNMPKVKAASQLSNAIAVVFQKFFSTSVTPNSNLVDVISLHNAQKVSFTYHATTKKHAVLFLVYQPRRAIRMALASGTNIREYPNHSNCTSY